jgi:hypothetical protein
MSGPNRTIDVAGMWTTGRDVMGWPAPPSDKLFSTVPCAARGRERMKSSDRRGCGRVQRGVEIAGISTGTEKAKLGGGEARAQRQREIAFCSIIVLVLCLCFLVSPRPARHP